MTIYLTTDTDGLVKHSTVGETTIKYFPNMLRLSTRKDDKPADMFIDQDINIPEHITAINGIDTMILKTMGVPANVAVTFIRDLFKDEPTIVTNNAKFHRLVLEAFMFRQGEELTDATWVDIQQMYKNVCKLESKKAGDYKLPKLGEVENFLKESGITPAGTTQLDIIESAHKNWEELNERAKKEDELTSY